MGLLAEIQDQAVNSDRSVTSLLRKCLVLASRIDSDVLEDWVKLELNGYPSEVEVPSYRRIQMNIKGHFAAGYGLALRDAPIPPHVVETVTGSSQFEWFQMRQAISTIADDAEARTGQTYRVSLDNLALVLGMRVYEGYNALQVWGEISSLSCIGVIEAVRNRVLDFSLALERTFPQAGEVGGMDGGSDLTKQTIQNIFNNTINGNVGMIGNANSSHINISFGAGDLQALTTYLSDTGIEVSDLAELEVALRNEASITSPTKFGPRVSSWIAKMTEKAASGAWDVSIGTAGNLLANALLRYYGLI